ncbi:FHA domain-containing protein [Actinomycetospora sp. C-140]
MVGDDRHGQTGDDPPQQLGWVQQGSPDGRPRELAASLIVDDGSHRSHRLVTGPNVIGRGEDAHVVLADISVSRRHFVVEWDGRHATLSDRWSTSGTLVNGVPTQTCRLADGDTIRVGHSTLHFRTRA